MDTKGYVAALALQASTPGAPLHLAREAERLMALHGYSAEDLVETLTGEVTQKVAERDR